MKESIKKEGLHSHETDIMLKLLVQGECIQTSLMEICSNNNILKKNLAKLVDSGYVVRRVVEEPRLSYRYDLTEKGRDVAMGIQFVDMIAFGELDMEGSTIMESICEYLGHQKVSERKHSSDLKGKK